MLGGGFGQNLTAGVAVGWESGPMPDDGKYGAYGTGWVSRIAGAVLYALGESLVVGGELPPGLGYGGQVSIGYRYENWVDGNFTVLVANQLDGRGAKKSLSPRATYGGAGVALGLTAKDRVRLELDLLYQLGFVDPPERGRAYEFNHGVGANLAITAAWDL